MGPLAGRAHWAFDLTSPTLTVDRGLLLVMVEEPMQRYAESEQGACTQGQE
jgi:hypothetical protein